LFALGQAAKISVFRVMNATGALDDTASDTQTLSGNVNGAAMANFDGKFLATAAARQRMVGLVTADTAATDPTAMVPHAMIEEPW
jgi:hypothetical protein